MTVADKILTLCQALKGKSHPKDGWEILRKFADEEKKTDKINQVLGDYDNVLRVPIEFQEALERGICKDEDNFSFLQGDIISTESAYYLGMRVENSPLYAIGTSTCDLSDGRRECVTLYPIKEILKPHDEQQRNETNSLISVGLKFRSTQWIILPKLPHQGDDVIYNLLDFTRPHQIQSDRLKDSHRLYSMKILGWRIFSSVLSYISSREANNEEALREDEIKLNNQGRVI